MAKCNVCDKEMHRAAGCTASKLQFTPFTRKLSMEELQELAEGKLDSKTVTDASQSKTFDRIPYGQERRYGALDEATARRCHDCGAMPGRFHHAGCDVEECPRCRLQLIGCSCNDEGLFSDVIERPKATKGARVQ